MSHTPFTEAYIQHPSGKSLPISRLFFLTAQVFETSEWPLERIGLQNPTINSLKKVACIFSAYHAVKRSYFVRNSLTGSNINSRLKGAVDRELGGKYIDEKSQLSMFDIFAEKLIL